MLTEHLEQGEGFTNTDRAVADFILIRGEGVLNMNLRQVAEAAYVSPAAVTRFCRRLGFESYAAFKLRFSRELTEEWQKLHQVDTNLPFSGKESPEALLSGVSNLAISHLMHMRDTLDPKLIQRAGKLLSRKKYIDIYGYGLSLESSREFAEKMAHIGYIVTPLSSVSMQSHHACFSTPEQAAIAVSYSGMRNQLIEDVKRLKQNGTPVVVITGNSQSALLESAAVRLVVDSEEKLVMQEKMDSFGALYMFHLIFDCLFSVIFSEDYEGNLRRIRQSSTGQFR